ncbi:MAG: (Fe-S)-binding protein [Thermodesulfobacteriota bacterium]
MEPRLEKVSLFLPCLADAFYPALGRAVIKILRKAGLEVLYPAEQTCCGQWAVNQGRPDAARPLARHFLRVFAGARAVVCPSASCVLTVRDYPALFPDPVWRRRAEETAARVFELTDFLVNVIRRPDLGARLPVRAAVHDSCHPLRGLGLKNEPRDLLSRVRGLELVELAEPETCCGFGGVFMAKYAALSRALVEEKINQALAAGVDLLVLTEPGCLLNVESALKDRGDRLEALHLAQVLARGIEAADA